jgi:tetratricopeptide (TPR) repeat protein
MSSENAPDPKHEERSGWTTSILCCLCGIGLIGSSLLRWWSFLDYGQPKTVLVCRGVCAVLGFLVVIFSIIRRPAWVAKRVAPIAFLLPIVMLLVMAVYEPKLPLAVIEQNGQIDRVISNLTAVDLEPNVPWVYDRELHSRGVVRNDFTVVDEIESEAAYAQLGFYGCLFLGLILGLVVAASRNDFGYSRGPSLKYYGVALLVLVVALALPLGMGHYYYHQARALESSGDYRGAIASFHRAIGWDRRLDADCAMHFDLGRLYGRLGMTNEPDCMAAVADMYESTGTTDAAEIDSGFFIYDRLNRQNKSEVNPAMAMRMANAYLRRGVMLYGNGNDLSAIENWQRALQVDPDNLEIEWDLATALTRQGYYRAAIDAWTKIEKQNESAGFMRSKFVAGLTYRKMISARAWSTMSWCYYKLGDLDNAQACRFNAIDLGSSYLPIEAND